VQLAVLALFGYAGTRRLVVRRLTVHMPRLPAAYDGLRVVQVSDLHVGPHTPRGFLERVARAARDEQPDLLVISGDQVDDFARDVELFNRAFADLAAPCGVFTVAGNHDVYAGWEAVHRGLPVLEAGDGNPPAGPLPALHPPRDQLLGHPLPPGHAAGGRGADPQGRRRAGRSEWRFCVLELQQSFT